MKKVLCFALILTLVLCGAAFADEEEPAWYELSADGTVLTVRMSANGTTGYEWTYAVSDPEGMELITDEYIAPESGKLGASGTWVASFRPLGEAEHSEQLTFAYARSWEGCPITLRTIDITVQADGTLTIDSVADTTDWVSLKDEYATLSLALPANGTTGYQWTCDIENADVLEMTEEAYIAPENTGLAGAGGTWTAAFRATGTDTGVANISLYYARSWENTYVHHYTLTVTVLEDGRIQLSDVHMNTMP